MLARSLSARRGEGPDAAALYETFARPVEEAVDRAGCVFERRAFELMPTDRRLFLEQDVDEEGVIRANAARPYIDDAVWRGVLVNACRFASVDLQNRVMLLWYMDQDYDPEGAHPNPGLLAMLLAEAILAQNEPVVAAGFELENQEMDLDETMRILIGDERSRVEHVVRCLRCGADSTMARARATAQGREDLARAFLVNDDEAS